MAEKELEAVYKPGEDGILSGTHWYKGHGNYVSWNPEYSETITLDGEFTLEELRHLLKVMEDGNTNDL